jgi:hypothetical protein
MATQEDAFIKAMRLAAHTSPEFFSLKDGDFYFLDWKLTAWMAISLSDLLHEMFGLGRFAATAGLEVAA